MKKFLIGLIIVLVVIIIGLVIYSQQPKAVQPVACTEEAKLCPDGVTSVGRQGPNCEFAPCPVAQVSVTENQVVEEKTNLVTLTGTVGADTYNTKEPFPIGGVCFTPDAESAKLLPKKAGDTRSAWFCFTEQKSAITQFGWSEEMNSNCDGISAKAKIVIDLDSYEIFSKQTVGFDKTNLVKVIEIGNTSCLKL
jgi:hypothetical protein